MGVQVNGPSYIYGDNMSVIHNTQQPELTLKKKSNSVFYHVIHKSVAMSESLTGHISMHDNPADNLYKDYSQWDKMRSLGWSNII
jgi:hypothetical protein